MKVVALLTLLATSVLVVKWGQPVDPAQAATFGLTAATSLASTTIYLHDVRP